MTLGFDSVKHGDANLGQFRSILGDFVGAEGRFEDGASESFNYV
jgi:hypothetical protein